jgi:hypothetical protein
MAISREKKPPQRKIDTLRCSSKLDLYRRRQRRQYRGAGVKHERGGTAKAAPSPQVGKPLERQKAQESID